MKLNISIDRYISNKQGPKHELAASVDEIIKIVGVTKTYNYSYWLKKTKGVPFNKVLEVCKESRTLDKKYNIGGFFTNRLKELQRCV